MYVYNIYKYTHTYMHIQCMCSLYLSWHPYMGQKSEKSLNNVLTIIDEPYVCAA